MANDNWKVSLAVTAEMATQAQKLARHLGLVSEVKVNPSPKIIGDQLETHIVEIDFRSVEGLRIYGVADDEAMRGRLRI